MKKHGLTNRDVEEDVIEVVDPVIDDYRRWLASFIAPLFGCTVVEHKREGLGFKGVRARLAQARDLYQKQLREADRSKMPPIAPWMQADANKIWEFFFWDGFASVMRDRFADWRKTAKVAEEAMSLASERVQAVPQAVSDVRSAASRLRNFIDIRWLEREAYAAGKKTGEQLTIAPEHLALSAGR